MKDEDIIIIKHRLDQAHEAIEDALFLLNGKRTPQSIINRAYYAMFYAALALLQDSGKIPAKHTGVISLFDTEFVVPGYFPRERCLSLPALYPEGAAGGRHHGSAHSSLYCNSPVTRKPRHQSSPHQALPHPL